MVKESDKQREEIAELKRRIGKLERDINSEDEESFSEEKEEPVFHDKKKKYVRILVILVIILLLMDVIALVAYYKPNFSGFFKSGSSATGSNSNNSAVKGQCKDGTKEGVCSSDKPYFCYEGNLVKKAAGCGCPAGYKIDFQDCKRG